MRCLFLALLLLSFISDARAQDKFNTLVPKEIVILRSTKSYDAALKSAQDASVRLRKKLYLQGYRPNKQNGLSLSKSDCEGDGFDYPCYVARGDGAADSSNYISIEYSNAYEGFAKGFYMVVAAIGDVRSPIVNNALISARKIYADAYSKKTRVWFGCMH